MKEFFEMCLVLFRSKLWSSGVNDDIGAPEGSNAILAGNKKKAKLESLRLESSNIDNSNSAGASEASYSLLKQLNLYQNKFSQIKLVRMSYTRTRRKIQRLNMNLRILRERLYLPLCFRYFSPVETPIRML